MSLEALRSGNLIWPRVPTLEAGDRNITIRAIARVTDLSVNTVTYSSTLGLIDPPDLRIKRYEGMKSDHHTAPMKRRATKDRSPIHPTSRTTSSHLGHPDYKTLRIMPSTLTYPDMLAGKGRGG